MVTCDPNPTDDGFLARALAGDQAALEVIWLRNLPAVEAILRLRVGPALRAHESLRDLTQSIFREMVDQTHAFAPDGNEAAFRNWLLTLATRKVLHRAEYWAAQKRDQAREAQALSQDQARGLLDQYSTLMTPSRVAMAREEVARIESAFDLLSEDERQVLIRSRFIGSSLAEIAREDGVSEGTIRSRLHRALARLSTSLAED
ncbi:MAG: RNA polymerase sigma factor [Planctomycetes bacterium]|nr:RNA polymerase sigma factor [Planctomycetota bacterium]